MRVAKWQGLGNDYLVVEESELRGEVVPELVRALCDRHLGVGADGVLVNYPPSGSLPGAIARMRIFNPDGSESEMCGNGMRIFARYLHAAGLVGEGEFVVETLAGAIRPQLGEGKRVRVDMGWARFRSSGVTEAAGPEDIVDSALKAGGEDYRFTFVDVGNPHCVVQVDDPDAFDVTGVGPLIENHAYFPNRVNVEFISVLADGSVRMRVWERGVGETQACGTGATAVGAACVRMGLATSPVVVHLAGGDLIIEATPESESGGTGAMHVHMTGPAEEVFTAELSDEFVLKLGQP